MALKQQATTEARSVRCARPESKPRPGSPLAVQDVAMRVALHSHLALLSPSRGGGAYSELTSTSLRAAMAKRANVNMRTVAYFMV